MTNSFLETSAGSLERNGYLTHTFWIELFCGESGTKERITKPPWWMPWNEEFIGKTKDFRWRWKEVKKGFPPRIAANSWIGKKIRLLYGFWTVLFYRLAFLIKTNSAFCWISKKLKKTYKILSSAGNTSHAWRNSNLKHPPSYKLGLVRLRIAPPCWESRTHLSLSRDACRTPTKKEGPFEGIIILLRVQNILPAVITGMCRNCRRGLLSYCSERRRRRWRCSLGRTTGSSCAAY